LLQSEGIKEKVAAMYLVIGSAIQYYTPKFGATAISISIEELVACLNDFVINILKDGKDD
jgi:hypothetical protein